MYITHIDFQYQISYYVQYKLGQSIILKQTIIVSPMCYESASILTILNTKIDPAVSVQHVLTF